MVTFTRYVAASQTRLEEARGIAEGLRGDEDLHRLAMRAVFVLEDCHAMLVRCGGPGDIEPVDIDACLERDKTTPRVLPAAPGDRPAARRRR